MPAGGERLAETLRLLGACRVDLDADQVLDVLWLARRLPVGPESPLHRQAPARPQQPAPPDAPETGDRPAPRQPPPEPGDPELPDLTSPTTLHAAAGDAPGPRPRPSSAGRENRRALPVRVPEEKALGNELELGRSLRPLRRRHDSRHRTEIDEDRTAAELAETNLPDVVVRPVRERWLNLVLLVDDGLSMLLWHRLGTELRALLERLGAFSLTRVLGLDTRGAGRPRLRARPFGPGSTELPLSTVNDPSGRSLLLVVSDGMGPAWRSGAMHTMLAERAARGPVAVLHTLPPDMWGGLRRLRRALAGHHPAGRRRQHLVEDRRPGAAARAEPVRRHPGPRPRTHRRLPRRLGPPARLPGHHRRTPAAGPTRPGGGPRPRGT